MTSVSNAVAKVRPARSRSSGGAARHFDAVLPDHIDVKSFIGTAAGALYADDTHGGRDRPETLITALMRCAALGHQPGTEEFYLTPRKVQGRPTILGIEGYRGIVERMYRSGAVATVVVREVCANDSFRYTEGQDDKPVHTFGGYGKTGADFFGANGSHDRGHMVGVYAYAVLTTGAVSRVVILNRADVEAARDAGGYRAERPLQPVEPLRRRERPPGVPGTVDVVEDRSAAPGAMGAHLRQIPARDAARLSRGKPRDARRDAGPARAAAQPRRRARRRRNHRRPAGRQQLAGHRPAGRRVVTGHPPFLSVERPSTADIEIACCELEEVAVRLDAGQSVPEIALAMGMSREHVEQYDRTLSNLLAALRAPTAACSGGIKP